MHYLLRHIESIIKDYSGHPPLAGWLKAYYKTHPKLGSRDRKTVSEAVYSYYRNACSFPKETPPIYVIKALQSTDTSLFLSRLLDGVEGSAESRLDIAHTPLPLSAPLPAEAWLMSLRKMPSLFIRLRAIAKSIQLLTRAGVSFTPVSLPFQEDGTCVRLSNTTAVDALLPEYNYVVQDAASQTSLALVLGWLKAAEAAVPRQVWDVCAGSGGKSIYLKDNLPPFALTATDVRSSVLHNLRQRFTRYRLGQYRAFALDMMDPQMIRHKMQQASYDLIICDVPCSGSGTWARSPEQFHFFEQEAIKKYTALQLPIVRHAWPHLRAGGYLAYITCSVFEQENEAVVSQIKQQDDAVLVRQQLIDGTSMDADSMFVALFRKKGAGAE